MLPVALVLSFFRVVVVMLSTSGFVDDVICPIEQAMQVGRILKVTHLGKHWTERWTVMSTSELSAFGVSNNNKWLWLMWMVVATCQLLLGSQFKSVGLDWGLAVTQRSVYIQQMNSRNIFSHCYRSVGWHALWRTHFAIWCKTRSTTSLRWSSTRATAPQTVMRTWSGAVTSSTARLSIYSSLFSAAVQCEPVPDNFAYNVYKVKQLNDNVKECGGNSMLINNAKTRQ